MKSARRSALLSMTAVAAISTSLALADDSGWYVGANAGYSRANIDNTRIADGLLSAGFATTSINDDEGHFGYKLFGGYEFNRYFALEGGYFDLGRFGFTADTLPPGALSGDMKVQGVNLDAVGILPFTEKFAALGRVGLNYAYTKDAFAGSGSVDVLDPERSQHAANYKFGVGLQYKFTEFLAMRAEAERYRVDDAVGNKGDIDLYTIGLVYRFGKKAPLAAAPAPSPAPPPPPLAEPILEIVPVPAASQQYCTVLDIQFDVNVDAIEREDKEKLRAVGTFLTKYPDTTAQIEGHTDDVGTAEANLKLSQRRAQSVVSYLESNFPIAASRLTAVGYGDTRPVADNRTQEGKRMNRRIDAVMACVTDIEGLTVVPARITMALMIEFDHNSFDIKPQYRDGLANLANFLKANPTVTATVEGHTANLSATPQLALEISRRRAQSVVSYLVDNFGIAPSRLSTEAFGQTRRVAYNTTLEGQQENRRVNVIINYPK
jgi:OmpA-OmpF porin, OOP family